MYTLFSWNKFCKIPQKYGQTLKTEPDPPGEFYYPPAKKEFCQNSKIGSQESGMKIWTILSKIRAPRPPAKTKISNFPSEFYVEPKYMKKMFCCGWVFDIDKWHWDQNMIFYLATRLPALMAVILVLKHS